MPTKISLPFSNPVFVIGCPRSGTSVLAWAVSQHKDFWTSAESDYLMHLFGDNQVISAYTKAVSRPDTGWLKKHNISYTEFASFVGMGIDQMITRQASGRRWVDSTPMYTLMVEALADMFPNAKFLHIIRDGRDVVNSLLHMNIRSIGISIPAVKNFKTQCETWVKYVSEGQTFGEQFPDRYLEVRQEHLNTRPEFLFNEIYRFLDADLCTKAAVFVKTKRLNSSYDPGQKSAVTIKKASSKQKPRWQDWSNDKKRTFAAIAGKRMDKLGYEVNF